MKQPDECDRRAFLLRTGAGIATLSAWGPMSTMGRAAAVARKPNIIVILSDDVGYNDCEANAHQTPIHTPNLRRLAEGGVTFTQGYAPASMCTPSRVGMLSGIAPARFGVYDVGGDSAFTWPQEQRILPQLLKEKGYATACIGKWHCGGDIPEWGYNHPLRRGFDRFWGFMGSTHDYWKPEPGSGFNGAGYSSCGYQPIYYQDRVVERIGYLTSDINRQSVRFIEENRDRPFFLYVAHHCDHVPLQSPRDLHDAHKPLGLGENTTTTRAMLEEMDRGIGDILDTLETHGLARDTLVIYSSDNGGGERSGQVNGILRGGKFNLMEGGIRVPMLMRWPGHIPANRIYCDPVWNLDFLPTILGATGIAPPPATEGVNLLPHLTGDKHASPHEALFWKMPEHTGEFAVRSGSHKLVYTSTGRGLYDLAADPGETHDLRAAQPETVRRLQALYDAWDNRNKPSLWGPQYHRKYNVPRKSGNPFENAGYNYSPNFGAD